ncbi:MAG: oxidoreductase-like domain-containing protein [Oceanococcus sp.]
MNVKSENQVLRAGARPQPPEKPLPSDCCDSGCEPCVMDRYLDDLAAYELAMSNWQRVQNDLDAPKGE